MMEMTSDSTTGCPQVKLMLIEAAVMDLEDALGDMDRALEKARASARRIKNMLNDPGVTDTINNLPENRPEPSLWEQRPPLNCRCGNLRGL